FVKTDEETKKKVIKSGSTSTNQFQDRIRNFFERKLQKYAVSQIENGIALFDGSLTTNTWDTPIPYMTGMRDLASSKNNAIIAISKKSTVEVNGTKISYLLDDTPNAGYKRINIQERSLGTIFATRMSMGGFTFRTDVCPTPVRPSAEEVLNLFYTNCRMNLGYPVLLKLAHIHSVFTKSEVLLLQVYASKKYGIKMKKPIDLTPLFAPFPKR
ncbi:MAG: hypothetical protein ACT4NT_04575, partial [Nitrososphaerota archaeon]